MSTTAVRCRRILLGNFFFNRSYADEMPGVEEQSRGVYLSTRRGEHHSDTAVRCRRILLGNFFFNRSYADEMPGVEEQSRGVYLSTRRGEHHSDTAVHCRRMIKKEIGRMAEPG